MAVPPCPGRLDLFTAIVQTTVKEASRNDIPLTIKMRRVSLMTTYVLESAKVARDTGVAAIALHGRTAAQRIIQVRLSWDSGAQLRELISGYYRFWVMAIFFSAEDAVRMVSEQTGVDSNAVIGRGCRDSPVAVW